MTRMLTVIAVPLALAACGSGKTVEADNASIAEVTEATRGAVKLDPGKWENKVSFLSADAPGLPPQVAEMMKRQMASAAHRIQTTCVTKAMADKPTGEMFAGKDNGQCRYEHFEMGGGKVDAVMVCKDARGQGGGVRMTMAGTFNPTAYAMTSEMKMTMQGAAGATPMTIRTRVEGKRIGYCDVPKA